MHQIDRLWAGSLGRKSKRGLPPPRGERGRFALHMRQMSHYHCDTCRMAMPTSARVTRRERENPLNVVFALGNRASADDIRQRLAGDSPSDSSVRVMLARLEQKGLLRHAVDGVRFVYSATRSPAAAGRSALSELVQTFYNGSTVQMMTALVRRGTWSSDELDTLEAAIEAARAQERPGKTSEP